MGVSIESTDLYEGAWQGGRGQLATVATATAHKDRRWSLGLKLEWFGVGADKSQRLKDIPATSYP